MLLHYVKCDGGLNHYMAAVDGPFALTRTYSIFWDSEEGEEKKDSMVLQIGNARCLLARPTRNENHSRDWGIVGDFASLGDVINGVGRLAACCVLGEQADDHGKLQSAGA